MLDFYVVSHGLQCGSVIEVLSAVGTQDRRPAKFTLQGTKQTPLLAHLRAPRQFPRERPAGCYLQKQRWDFVLALLETNPRVDITWAVVVTVMESEFLEI